MAAQAARPAATLALLRDAPDGPQVLMLQRSPHSVFLGGAYVFPGGSLETADTDPRLAKRLKNLPGENPPIPYWIAALRECYEEAGILLACDARGKPIAPERASRLAADRNRPFIELLEAEDLYLPAGELGYIGHWVTAPGRARRFDTRFFVAAAPPGQEGSHDAAETVHTLWISPREALERAARGEIELVHATKHTLGELKRTTSSPVSPSASTAG